MKEFWDKRYSEATYAYGIEPNAFFSDVIRDIKSKGNILMAAEGEGRNAVYAAKQGWQVTAFDQSQQAKQKALQLAERFSVSIDYTVSDIEELRYTEEQFDALALIYAHFPEERRRAYHRQLATYLKKGGVLLVEAFEKKHTVKQKENPNVGGPGNVAMLYSIAELMQDFEGFDFYILEEKEVELTEGLYHRGNAHVLRIAGRKQ
ncbi:MULTISPECIES: class I SAM-dependent methyltransferase [Myroides]|uniref:Methyltransferase domain-containing protein n=1 Tax=Myroides albus TaxID=2562892 RepID=A0A6I3LL01_9FLAO|nr:MULTISPECIES: class I SAM-dependent methyltransferase [Myroides]MTG97181.1 methyltransferase domain-containing protein [Myroides albus]MVX35178.1 methyltransferase domain-containing protein [Myroides sp. LoEW2-1]